MKAKIPRTRSKTASVAPRTTVTAAGMLRKTVYFDKAEWEAIRLAAYQEDRAYTDIIRDAVRRALGVTDEQTPEPTRRAARRRD